MAPEMVGAATIGSIPTSITPGPVTQPSTRSSTGLQPVHYNPIGFVIQTSAFNPPRPHPTALRLIDSTHASEQHTPQLRSVALILANPEILA
ncbi:hypothetical protein WAI453_009902 [Rhynchosporium graminicola]